MPCTFLDRCEEGVKRGCFLWFGLLSIKKLFCAMLKIEWKVLVSAFDLCLARSTKSKSLTMGHELGDLELFWFEMQRRWHFPPATTID